MSLAPTIGGGSGLPAAGWGPRRFLLQVGGGGSRTRMEGSTPTLSLRWMYVAPEMNGVASIIVAERPQPPPALP